jgi:GMP synthase-like glutamine amidotransferase
MRILIIEHQPDARSPDTLLADWARERGHEIVIARVPELRGWPDPRDYDAVASLGSDASVHASPPGWVADELEFLRRAHEHDVPALGICFGGQSLAAALGGVVERAPDVEVGWFELATGAPELITSGPWFWWHVDQFTLPPGAELLAGTETQTAAFVVGRSVGLQYHPEVDAELVNFWIDGGRAKLVSHGVDTEQLDREIAEFAPEARDRAFEQFDRIAAHWWGNGE